MEIDSSCHDSSKLVEFPKINTNSILTLKNNSINNIIEFSNNIVSIQTNKKKFEDKKQKQNMNYNKSKEFFKLLLAQKIAKNKINHMNFNKITSAITNYKNNYTTSEDPINKYINYFIPYEKKEDLSSDFIRVNKQFIYDIKNINIKKKKKENEKFISFKKDNSKKYNYYFSRMSNVEHNNKTINYEDNIIMIQKHIRGFILREKLNKEISRLIVNYIINNIILIQRAIRKFLNRKNYYKKEIIKIIQKERKVKASKIVDMFSMYHLRNEYKKFLLIKNILSVRVKSANIICRAIKYYLLGKKVKKIKQLQNNNLEIIYPIHNKKRVKLKIYCNDNKCKSFDFQFCELRKIYVLYLNKDMIEKYINKNEFFCHFFVDDECVIDKRYKIVKNKLGIVYNLIEFKNKEKRNSLNESFYNDIKTDKYIDKYEKIKTNSIPFKNENNLFSFHRNIKTNISNEIKNYNYYDSLFCIYQNNSINNININYKENGESKNKKNELKKLSTSESNINKNINNLKKYKINSYIESYINDYNDMHLYQNLGYRNNLVNYPQDISENFLGNSSSTISNSNAYIKNENRVSRKKKDLEQNKILIEDNKYNKKKKKMFPIFY